MNAEDILPTVAGFTAIIVSIRAQRAESWNAEERIPIIGIVSVRGFVAVCAVHPYAIS